jgi:hypothetical protein
LANWHKQFCKNRVFSLNMKISSFLRNCGTHQQNQTIWYFRRLAKMYSQIFLSFFCQESGASADVYLQ